MVIGASCDCVRRLEYWSKLVSYFPEKYLLQLDMLIYAVETTDPKRARLIHFPFVTRDHEDKPINWYIRSDAKSWWHKFRQWMGFCDDLIAVHFHDGKATILSQIEAGVSKHMRTYDLADPNSFTNLGKHIFKLLT